MVALWAVLSAAGLFLGGWLAYELVVDVALATASWRPDEPRPCCLPDRPSALTVTQAIDAAMADDNQRRYRRLMLRG